MRTILAVWLPLTFSFVCLLGLISVSYGFAVPLVFGLGDARARFCEFRRFRGTRTRAVLRSMKSSACQRYAAMAAFHSVKDAREYYRNLGYRWYHVLPDGTFSLRNCCYFKLVFYKRLLGLK